MPRLQRPTVEPLPLRQAFVARLRRLDGRTTLRRAVVGAAILLLVNLGLSWKTTIDGLGQRREVPTMLRGVPAGAVITADDVTMADWPIDLLPAGSTQRLPIGEIASSDLVAGEVVIAGRLFPTSEGLAPDDRLVTIPQPLASPPAARGTAVELYGILAVGDGFTTPATLLTSGVVFRVTETSLAVVIGGADVPIVIEHLAFGTIDVVIRP